MAAATRPMASVPRQDGEGRRRARPAATPIRVLIVDQHRRLRERLAAVINRAAGMVVAGSASSGGEALDLFRSTRPDVVALDLQLPDMAAESLVSRIFTESPGAPMVAVTVVESDPEMIWALEAGIQGWVRKGPPYEALLDAIRTVHVGGQMFPAGVAARRRLGTKHSVRARFKCSC